MYSTERAGCPAWRKVLRWVALSSSPWVPGRKGMSYTEEDWVDEDATSHGETDE